MKKILMSLIMCMFLISFASALEIDNTYIYDPITREATFYNTFLGIKTSQIGTARLDTPLLVKIEGTGYRNVGNLTICSYGDYSDALKPIKIKDLKTNEDITQEADYLIIDGYKDVKIDDYKIECSESWSDINQSYNTDCQRVSDGYHYENKPDYKKLAPSDLKAGCVPAQIWTEVKAQDYKDWRPTIYGEEISEWAKWSSSIYTGIEAYYKFDEASGNAEDSTGNHTNGTATDIDYGSSGIINDGYIFTASSTDNVDLGFVQTSTAFTWNIWVNFTSSPSTTTYRCMSNQAGGSGVDISFVSGVPRVIIEHTGGAFDFFDATFDFDGHEDELYMVTVAYDDSDHTGYFYINGQPNGSGSVSNNVEWGTQDILIGNRPLLDRGFPGLLDGGMISNRRMSASEVLEVYDSGIAGDEYETPTPDSSPVITFNSPASANYTTSQALSFNYTASDDKNLTSVKFYVNTILNQTNASGLNNTDYIFNLTLGDGDYDIYGKATDNESQATNTATRTYIIDSTPPSITLNNVSNITIFEFPYNYTWNFTANDSHIDTCYYDLGYYSISYNYIYINQIATCNTSITSLINDGLTQTNGQAFFIEAKANDTLGNEGTSGVTWFSLNYVNATPTYETSILEGETNNIYLNLSANVINNFNGTLYYNGTATTATNTTGLLSSSFTVPKLSTNENISFYWTYNFNGVDYNTSTYYQELIYLTPINITSASCVDKALRFDLQDEENLTAIYGDVDYNFNFGTTNSSLKEIYGSLSNVTTFYVCINASASENYTIGYGELQYRDTNYVDRRYYLFNGQTISNNTLTNHTLRSILETEQTSFSLAFEDTDLNVYSNKYSALWRWYPNLDDYQIVEMGKTDEDGETVAHINTEDTDYRIALYEPNGSLIKLGDPKRFLCTSAPCSFTLRVDAGAIDYIGALGVEAYINFNETSEVFTLTYNDPTQATSNMQFLVTRETGTSTLVICNKSSSSFTGVITCNTSAVDGIKKAIAYRSASPAVIVAQKLVGAGSTLFRTELGLFISFILWLIIIATGFGNSPLWIIIMAVIALIPAVILGSINLAVFTGIAVLGAIIIHFIKRGLAR